jgi:hypothetical protein
MLLRELKASHVRRLLLAAAALALLPTLPGAQAAGLHVSARSIPDSFNNAFWQSNEIIGGPSWIQVNVTGETRSGGADAYGGIFLESAAAWGHSTEAWAWFAYHHTSISSSNPTVRGGPATVWRAGGGYKAGFGFAFIFPKPTNGSYRMVILSTGANLSVSFVKTQNHTTIEPAQSGNNATFVPAESFRRTTVFAGVPNAGAEAMVQARQRVHSAGNVAAMLAFNDPTVASWSGPVSGDHCNPVTGQGGLACEHTYALDGGPGNYTFDIQTSAEDTSSWLMTAPLPSP